MPTVRDGERPHVVDSSPRIDQRWLITVWTSHMENPRARIAQSRESPGGDCNRKMLGKGFGSCGREGHRASRDHVRSLTIELVGRAEKVACVLRSGTLPPGQSNEPRAPAEWAGRSAGQGQSGVGRQE